MEDLRQSLATVAAMHTEGLITLEEARELREGQLTLYASAHKAQRELVQAARAHRAAHGVFVGCHIGGDD